MQIITGKYRSRKLVSVESEQTRPTLARVKESIFNLIQTEVAGSRVLDLFAGSGAFGAECISRGASQVIFVDHGKEAVKAIRTNTKNMTENFEIVESDFKVALEDLYSKGYQFDLIFLDPPYKSGFAAEVLQLLSLKKLLAPGAIIVVEHEFENDLQNIPSCYIIEKSRKYGIARVDILRYVKE